MSDPQTRTPEQLKVSELKEELKKRGITPKGLKKDLVEKLEEVLQKEAEEHLSNTPRDNLSLQVPHGSNSPVEGKVTHSPVQGSNDVDSSVLRSNNYSPLPVADSNQGYSAVLSAADSRNEGSNSLSQVAVTENTDSISNQQVVGHANSGHFESKDAEIKRQESDHMLEAGDESALEPEQMECDNQKEENMEHVVSAENSSLGLASGSEHLCHDGKKGSADDSEIRETCFGANEKPVDACGSESLGFTACFQASISADEKEAKPDESSMLSHVGPSMVETNINTLEEHILCQSLDPLLDKVGADAKSRIEKGDIIHASDNIVNQISSKASSEYEEVEKEENEIRLTANKDENLRTSVIGLDYTKSEVVTVGQNIHQHSSTIHHDLKSEPRQNYKDSEPTVQQNIVESKPLRESEKIENTEQASKSGKLSETDLQQNIAESKPLRETEKIENTEQASQSVKLSETGRKFEDIQRSEVNPVCPDKSESNAKDIQMLESNVVCTLNMEPAYAQNQYTRVDSPTSVLKTSLRTDHEGVGSAHFNQNNEESHSLRASTVEVGEAENKENSQSSDKGLALKETCINMAEQQVTKRVEFDAEKSQDISFHCNMGKLKPKLTCSTEILETAQNEHSEAECSCTIVMDEITHEDQEAKTNFLTYQSDGVSILTTSNIISEMHQKQPSYKDGQVEYQVGQNDGSSFALPHHRSECDTGNNIKQSEAKEHNQVMEDDYECINLSVQESEQESKARFPGFQRDGPSQSLGANSSMAEGRKHEIISGLEDSAEQDFLHSQNTVQNSILYESEIKPTANAEVLDGNNEPIMRTRKEEHKKLEIETDELIMEGDNELLISVTDEWNIKSEFPDQHFKLDSDSQKERFEDHETRKLEHIETVEYAPMDVDFDGQVGQKQKDKHITLDDEPKHEPAKRQRRWNSGKNLLEAGNTKSLTTDTLKDVISQEAVDGSVVSSSLRPSVSHLASTSTQSFSKAEKTSFSRPAPPPLKGDSASYEEYQKPRIVPPSLRSPTNTLKVERFLRPFTLKALKELLSETGTVTYFWIDPIKTHCYVTYSSVEEAVATRNALYNLKWPIIGGRLLIAEFVEHEEAMSHGESQSSNLASTRNSLPQKNVPQVPSSLPTQESLVQALRSPLQLDSKAKTPMLPKKDPAPEPAVYTLDDLFKKTRAKPHIYYLPLNKDQVAAKLAARIQDH